MHPPGPVHRSRTRRRSTNPEKPVPDDDLGQWLKSLETLHPREIDLGLERISEVADRMGLRRDAAATIIVAGTNGKGSSVACLESMFQAHGARPGAYTSPHLLRYNERIRVAGVEATDDLILSAFRAIDAARGTISLSYFEFSTLAAAWCFREMGAAPWILEVGLGGRLDACNAFDADLAVITPIDLDHMEWLGDNREAIAGEKMGVIREGRPVVCSDPRPPARIAEVAGGLDAPLSQLGRDYTVEEVTDRTWDWRGPRGDHLAALPRPGWLPDTALGNAAGAVMAVRQPGPFHLPVEAIHRGLEQASLAGRLQTTVCRGHQWLLDVGHNPAAVELLAGRLESVPGRVRMVFGLMARKPPGPLLDRLVPRVDEWFCLDLDDPQSHSPEQLRCALEERGARVLGSGGGDRAIASIHERSEPGDLAVGAGSFRVVEALMRAGVGACNEQA